MPDGTSGTSSHLHAARANESREDPHTEPHVPAHAAPRGNPSPITLEDMSDQEGMGSASLRGEATLTHPSARDSTPRPASRVRGNFLAQPATILQLSLIHI